MPLTKLRSHYKPFEYEWAFQAYELQQKMHWLPHEAPMAEDVKDWNDRLSVNERSLLTNLFQFFTQADVDISEGYAERYLPNFPVPEIRMMLLAFGAAEANHMHSYATLIETLGLPESSFHAFTQFEAMRDKHEYYFERDLAGMSEAEAMALDLAIFSAFGEGMQLFSTFAILMNFQRHGTMKGMSTIVEWSIRDESLHVESMIKLFRTFIAENPGIWTDELRGRIYQTCRDMVELEDAFIDQAFSFGELPDLNPDDVKTFVRYIADRRLMQLGLKPNYGVEETPFEWLDWLLVAPTHANFFEQRSTEYSKSQAKGWDAAFKRTGEILRKHRRDDKLVVYTMPGCPHCYRVKAMASSHGFRVEERSHLDYPRDRKPEEPVTFPRVLIKSREEEEDHSYLIGGADEFAAYLQEPH